MFQFSLLLHWANEDLWIEMFALLKMFKKITIAIKLKKTYFSIGCNKGKNKTSLSISFIKQSTKIENNVRDRLVQPCAKPSLCNIKVFRFIAIKINNAFINTINVPDYTCHITYLLLPSLILYQK